MILGEGEIPFFINVSTSFLIFWTPRPHESCQGVLQIILDLFNDS